MEYLSHIEGIIIDHVYISNKVDRQLVVLDYDLFILNLSCWSWVVFVADVDIVKLEVKVDFCWLLMDILP